MFHLHTEQHKKEKMKQATMATSASDEEEDEEDRRLQKKLRKLLKRQRQQQRQQPQPTPPEVPLETMPPPRPKPAFVPGMCACLLSRVGGRCLPTRDPNPTPCNPDGTHSHLHRPNQPDAGGAVAARGAGAALCLGEGGSYERFIGLCCTAAVVLIRRRWPAEGE